MKASWDGFTYNLDDPDFVWSINNGRTEPYTRELAVVKSYLKHFPSCNHTYLDVGGHIGTTAFAYSRLFENVLAFEPNKKSYDFFVQNIELNGVKNVKVINKGAFNKTTSVSFVHHGPNSGCYYIKETEKSPSSIDTVRLDDLEFESPVDFIRPLNIENGRPCGAPFQDSTGRRPLKSSKRAQSARFESSVV